MPQPAAEGYRDFRSVLKLTTKGTFPVSLFPIGCCFKKGSGISHRRMQRKIFGKRPRKFSIFSCQFKFISKIKVKQYEVKLQSVFKVLYAHIIWSHLKSFLGTYLCNSNLLDNLTSNMYI